MNRATDVLQTILPVAVMLVIGMLCRSKKLLSREGINSLKSIVVNITLPAVLLNAFASTEYTLMDIVIPLAMFGVCVAAWALGKASMKIFRLNSRFVPFLTTGFEAGMLGYALFTMLYGSERTAEFARIDLGQVLFVFTLYKILLSISDPGQPGKSDAPGGAEKNGTDLKSLLKEMVASPIIIAIAAGVLIGATGLYQALIPSGISGILDACTGFVAAPTSAIILLTIGYDLVLGDIPWLSAGKVVLLRFGIMQLLRMALLLLLKVIWPESPLTAAINVMFILPPPFVLPVFADDEDQRVYVSSALSLSTLASILCFAVLAILAT
ncbi:MAG: AEC family transporter [Lachnospiraceae bacterium]|nr:AEC family transporter [Lachnospiraceae bacterium]